VREMLKSGAAVSLKFWRLEDAEVISAQNVICTGRFYPNGTVNLKFLNSGQFRTVRLIMVFEVNGMEVFI
jgi:hypothetical protein